MSTRELGPNSETPDARPTLKSIAFMTGLGVTTVSKALKDAPDISKATKERVALVARQVGYRPNRAGVRLRTGKTNVISLILDTEEEVVGITPHIIYGISEVIADTAFHLVVTPYSHSADPLEPVRYVVETGAADGIILSRTEPDDPRVHYLTERGMPFATHGRTEAGVEHAFHDFDNEAFARDAVAILLERGRGRLSLLGPPMQLTYARHMTAGFASAMAAGGGRQMPLGDITVDDTIEAIQRQVYEVMRTDQRPDGIVCGSANAAIGVTVGIERAGLVVGTDVDIVSKQSSVNYLRWFRPSINVIDEDFRAAGRDLARSVIGLIAGQPAGDFQFLTYSGQTRDV